MGPMRMGSFFEPLDDFEGSSSSTAASTSEPSSEVDDEDVLAWLETFEGVATAFTPAPPAPSSPGRLSLMSVGLARPTKAV